MLRLHVARRQPHEQLIQASIHGAPIAKEEKLELPFIWSKWTPQRSPASGQTYFPEEPPALGPHFQDPGNLRDFNFQYVQDQE